MTGSGPQASVVKAAFSIRSILVLLAAWLPVFFLWILSLRIAGVSSLRVAAGLASVPILSAAILTIPARRYCRSLPWPSRPGSAFALRHALAGSAFSLVWIASQYAYDAAARGEGIFALAAASPVLGWQLLQGLGLYGVIAGLTYALDLRRHAEEQGKRAVEAEAQAAAARLEAIRARLHPHFLFNALHSLGVLVRSDPPAAEAAVESLGQLLRLALSRDARPLVPMNEEWSFSRKYLEFERIRYGDRLNVSARIDDEALDCLVPPFSLHTMVENAVRHSVSLARGGRIEIRASVAADTLSVEVEDQGAPASGEPPSTGQKSGLASLRERMAGLYGGTGLLETRRLESGGFLARMSAPALRCDEGEADRSAGEERA